MNKSNSVKKISSDIKLNALYEILIVFLFYCPYFVFFATNGSTLAVFVPSVELNFLRFEQFALRLFDGCFKKYVNFAKIFVFT